MSIFDFFRRKGKKNENSNRLIFKDENGNQISQADLAGATGNYNWQIVSEKKAPREAMILHQESRAHGANGEYDKAISKLTKAMQLAPEWAYPPYDLGYTYLLQQDFDNALKYYEIANQLEPGGFFTAKTAYWSLKKEAEGEFLKGIYLAYMQIEWSDSQDEKLRLAQAILNKYPRYAPAWKTIASISDDHNERLEAIEKGLESSPDLETKGMLLINRALIMDVQGNKSKATEILGKMIFDQETTLGNKELAKFVLASITSKN